MTAPDDVEFFGAVIDRLGDKLVRVFESPNELDRNLEPANVVDGLFAIARSIHHVARAIEGVKTEDEHDVYHDGDGRRSPAQAGLAPLWAEVIDS